MAVGFSVGGRARRILTGGVSGAAARAAAVMTPGAKIAALWRSGRRVGEATGPAATRTLRFFGSSDDLVTARVADPGDGPDMVAGYDETVDFDEHAVFRVCAADGQGLLVFLQWLSRSSGTWVVGVAPLPGPQPLPDWPMRWQFGDSDYEASFERAMQGLAPAPCSAYSTQLDLTVPADAGVTVERVDAQAAMPWPDTQPARAGRRPPGFGVLCRAYARLAVSAVRRRVGLAPAGASSSRPAAGHAGGAPAGG